MVIPYIDKILAKFGFHNEKLRSKIENKVQNNFGKIINNTINIENFNIAPIPYHELKKEKNFEELLKKAFDSHTTLSTNKLVITRENDLSLEQIDTLKSNQIFIEKLKYQFLSQNFLELIENSIFLSKLGSKRIKQEKIKSSRIQNKVLNLYSSGWIEIWFNEFIDNKDINKDINKSFLELIRDNSIIFVNSYMNSKQLAEDIEINLYTKKICYLHAIGYKNIKLCEKTFKEILFEIEKTIEDRNDNWKKYTIIKKNY